MKSFVKSKKFILLLSLVLVLAISIHCTIAFVTTQAKPIENTFLPSVYALNDLTISKSVEHPFGEDYIIPENIAFEFELDLGEDYAGKELETTGGKMTVDENGKLKVTVRPGTPFIVQDLIDGTNVTVKELESSNAGFTVKDGKDTMTAVVSGSDSIDFDFINVYTPSSVKLEGINLTGTKTLSGRGWKDGDAFSFKLEYDSGSGDWNELATETVEYDAENDSFNVFDFSSAVHALEISETGTYSFRVSEIAGTLKGITYDSTVHSFSVVVSDSDMDGKLEVYDVNVSDDAELTSVSGSDVYDISVGYTNIYKEALDTEVKLNISKTVTNTGTQVIGPGNFSFVLENTATGATQSAKTDQNGKADIKLTYTGKDAGKTFSYKLYEIDAKQQGMTYSDKVYEVKVEVSLDASGNTAAALFVDGRQVTDFTAEFVNTYSGIVTPPEGSVSVRIPVIKTIKSDDADPIKPEGFEFVLRNVDNGAEITVESDEDGYAEFDLVYGESDAGKTYNYIITEKNGGRAGVTYSNASYEISVAVARDSSGELTAALVRNGAQIADFTAAFENIYEAPEKPADISIYLDIVKTVENKGLLSIGPEGFTFILENTDANTTVAAKTNEEGKGTFELTYTADDIGKIYSYKLSELNDGREGVTYSDAVYELQVAVSLGDDRQLHAVVTTGGEEVSSFTAEFVNTYYVPVEDITVTLTAKKEIKFGDKVKDDKEKAEVKAKLNIFSFVLESTDTSKKVTEKADSKGLAEFELEFTEKDVGKTFNYKLYEVKGSEAGYTYSTKVYEVHIKIELGDDGKLKPVITCDNKKVEEFIGVFENTYVGIPVEDIVVPITVNKTVTSRNSDTIGLQNFRFRLEKIREEGEDDDTRYYAKTDEEGIAEFRLTFSEDDIGKTYNYTLSEIDDGVKNVTYSDTVYDISITIKQGEDKQLTAELMLGEQPVESITVEFENIYDTTVTDKPGEGPGVLGGSDEVKPGDNTNLIFWSVMFILSALLLVVLIATRKKPEKAAVEAAGENTELTDAQSDD